MDNQYKTCSGNTCWPADHSNFKIFKFWDDEFNGNCMEIKSPTEKFSH